MYSKKIFVYLAACMMVFVPALGMAALSTPVASAASCEFDAKSTELCNPLPDKNLNDLIVRFLKTIFGLIGSLAVVVIVIAGFKMVISQGNEEKVGSARKSITWAVIGLIVAAMAYSLVNIVQNILVKQ